MGEKVQSLLPLNEIGGNNREHNIKDTIVIQCYLRSDFFNVFILLALFLAKTR